MSADDRFLVCVLIGALLGLCVAFLIADLWMIDMIWGLPTKGGRIWADLTNR